MPVKPPARKPSDQSRAALTHRVKFESMTRADIAVVQRYSRCESN